MNNIKKINFETYKVTVVASHWYYGTCTQDYMVDFSVYSSDVNAEYEVLKSIIENDIDFKYITWDEVTLYIDYIIDGKVYTTKTKYEY